jgi:DNA repair protein RadC
MAYPVFLFMVKRKQKHSIKGFAVNDQPREKLIQEGRRSLSDAELIAILIGSGSAGESVVALSRRILSEYGHSLTELGRASLEELKNFHGIGDAKAVIITAALEIGRRRKEETDQKKPVITCAKEAFEMMHPALADLNHEEFWIMMLNSANGVIGKAMISKGGRAGTIADPKVIFKTALERNAAYLILFHNHPSGNLKPSDEDIRITKKLIEAGKTLDLYVLDHLIVAGDSYLSLADQSLI